MVGIGVKDRIKVDTVYSQLGEVGKLIGNTVEGASEMLIIREGIADTVL